MEVERFADIAVEFRRRIEQTQMGVDDDRRRTKPEGYPLDHFFKAPTHPEYGLVRFDPWRIELWNVKELFAGTRPTVWRAPARPE